MYDRYATGIERDLKGRSGRHDPDFHPFDRMAAVRDIAKKPEIMGILFHTKRFSLG